MNRTISAVYYFIEGRVLTSDQEGQPIYELSGRYDDLHERITAVFPKDQWYRVPHGDQYIYWPLREPPYPRMDE